MNNTIFLMLFVAVIQPCFCKPPIIIPPKNPNDPAVLPAGVTKNVLVIGNNLTCTIY